MRALASRGAASVLDGAPVPVCASFGACGRVATSGASQSGCLHGRLGLALIVVVGILGVLAVLAAAFVAMAQLERRASEQRVNAARAYLLARSGIEDALARLELGQDPAYGGEDWDASGGTLSAFEGQQEIFHRGVADVESCPVRHAMRPSFFKRAAGGDPYLILVDGRQRGYSGSLEGSYALQVRSANAGIFVNGGALDDKDRDPDGPNAEPEAAPLAPNGIPDHRDASMEGPNGFLVRLLNNLEAVVTNGASSDLGARIVEARPPGGYASLDALPEKAKPFTRYLTLHAWVDEKVVKPQPVDGRPHRWEDIDDAHRIGREASEISGYKTLAAGADPRGMVLLNPGILGDGEAIPWTQTLTAANLYEALKVYPVSWERGFIYAASQLRAAPPAMESRAPVSAGAPEAVLAAVFLGLKGTTLETWDGSAGWDGGFGWQRSVALAQATYLYPSEGTEDTPWIRTRLDYGMTYGRPARPWYGPSGYDPHAPSSAIGRVKAGEADPGTLGPFQFPEQDAAANVPVGMGGKPVIQAAPLGRLRETAPIARAQALAIARAMQELPTPLRTWARFNAFVDALPRWEDLNDDGALDGIPYPVLGSGAIYTRRIYRREDLDSDGVMDNQSFPDGTRGLTFLQKDVLKAMANPNTDLNDLNPDANLFKEVDKTDLLDHTTELSLDGTAGTVRIRALGRILDSRGRLLASRQLTAAAVLAEVFRDTSQADFMRGEAEAPALRHPLAGEALTSYPEPASAEPATWDGQLSLGFVGAAPGPDETLRGDLSGTPDAGDDPALPDLRGPGSAFPDGVYSEKDRTLRYPLAGNLGEGAGTAFYAACWVKPGWLPEASPRAHALLSLSRAAERGRYHGPKVDAATVTGQYVLVQPVTGTNPYDIEVTRVPLDDILARPLGLYFVPARNNAAQDDMPLYDHSAASTRGGAWPRRCLLWGTTHSLYATGTLQRRGIDADRPLGRFEGRRWQHLAAVGLVGDRSGAGPTGSRLVLGRKADGDGGGLNNGFGRYSRAVGVSHADGSPNHLRFGEMASLHNMNYAADATFAGVRMGWRASGGAAAYADYFTGASGPAALGRYLREDGAAWRSAALPTGLRPLRITWTEIPCVPWFDEDGDGWMDAPQEDRDGNGLRDLRIALELWDGSRRLARFEDAAGENRLPAPSGDLHYRAVFVNEWDEATRQNHPLDVTPFLDDVTLHYQPAGGPRLLAFGEEGVE